jgi:murein hydrolase activator
MIKGIATICFFFFAVATLVAQPSKNQSREELEKQRKELKAESEALEKLLKENKKTTTENLVQLNVIDKKIGLQDRVIDNISRDINLLDNNIYNSQRDINKLKLILDTLKQEYAKSMVYAYKNRSSYDFINFIFSAKSFNDAIKRITYLKSYRNYREMQGENIIRTQDLLRQRIDELSGNKQKKSVALDDKSKEMAEMEKQKSQKAEIVNTLKAKGKELSTQLAARKKQLGKVNSAIAAAVKRAQDEARREAQALAEANRRKRAEEDKRERDRIAALNKANPGVTPTTPAPVKKSPTASVVPRKDVPEPADGLSVNVNFENNRGILPWPVDRGQISLGFGRGKSELGYDIDNPGITIAADIGTPVKAVFEGQVSSVVNVDNMQVVILQHGRYFSTYSNLSGVAVQRGQTVKIGQVIGRVMANEEGVGVIDFIMSNEKGNVDPMRWLRTR